MADWSLKILDFFNGNRYFNGFTSADYKFYIL